MNNARRMFLATVMCLTVAAAVWALPPQGQKPQMATGKISSVQKAGQGVLQDSFTLDITEDQTISVFLVPQSKINGTLTVGKMADCTYVFDKDGNKVAVTVTVK